MVIRIRKLTFLVVCTVVGFLYTTRMLPMIDTDTESLVSLFSRSMMATPSPEALVPLSFERLPQPGKLIDRIYYINLPRSVVRDVFQKSWTRKLPIPVERIEAREGRGDLCGPKQHPRTCVGVSGLTLTNLHILKDKNVSGVTLVVEDDFEITDMVALEDAFLKYVPDDWDVVRIDCWGKRPEVDYIHRPYIFKLKGKGVFWGGTHATIYRESSASKLYKLWSQKPFNKEIDGRLNTNELNSYCLSRREGFGKFLAKEMKRTTIPKLELIK